MFQFLRQRGQLLVEVLIIIGLLALVTPVLLIGFISTREGRAQDSQRFLALASLNEAKEAVRIVREAGWANIQTNGTYHPVISGSTWALSSGSQTSGVFTRSILIESVNRDSNNVIVTSGGTVDPSTKKITLTVNWTLPQNGTVSNTFYLTRFLESDTYTETTQAHFNFTGSSNPGVKSSVTVRGTNPPAVSDDGEVLLGAGGNADWCSPVLESNTLDLPKNGVANALSANAGNGYVGTGENASGVSFAKVNITATDPPIPSLGSTFDGYKTNDVYGETNYAYIGTDNNTKEVVIIDLNNVVSGKYQEVGYFNAPGNVSARSVFVSGNVGFAIVNAMLYSFDLSSKTGSRPQTGSVSLAGTGNKVRVFGTYAYVANNATTQLQIVDVSNPASMSVVGSAQISGAGQGWDIVTNSSVTRAYLATDSRMYIIDISTKTGSRPSLGNYNANGMSPKSLTVVPGNILILVGSNGEEYQVVNISNEASPVRCGGVDTGSSITGAAAVSDVLGNVYTYITVNANPEFRIIAGGPGGSYSTSGTFESMTFTPGYQTANNRLTATFDEPTNTDLQFQVSLADLVSGSCPVSGQYTFVGPDGTSATYFNQASGVPVTFPFTSTANYVNPGQCFRYKVYFNTTDTASTPVLQDVTINYSP